MRFRKEVKHLKMEKEERKQLFQQVKENTQRQNRGQNPNFVQTSMELVDATVDDLRTSQEQSEFGNADILNTSSMKRAQSTKFDSVFARQKMEREAA